MFDLTSLIEKITTDTGYVCVEDEFVIGDVNTKENNPVTVYCDYASVLTINEQEAINDVANEVDTSLMMYTSVVIDAPVSAYPEVFIDVYAACQYFKPYSPIPNIRPLTFSNADFKRVGKRRIALLLFGYTYDRYLSQV